MDYLADITQRFMPHGACFAWRPGILWLHIIGNLGAASAYMFGFRAAIVATLDRHGLVLDSVAARKLKRFVNWCGAGHFASFVTLFYGYYAVSGLILLVVGFVSWDFVLSVRAETDEGLGE